jgi:hypothetical protein
MADIDVRAELGFRYPPGSSTAVTLAQALATPAQRGVGLWWKEKIAGIARTFACRAHAASVASHALDILLLSYHHNSRRFCAS